MKNESVCPFCSTELIHGKKMLYETLCEHVLDPNGFNSTPMRVTWVCPNEDCILYQMGFWSDVEGSWYDYSIDNYIVNVPDIFSYTKDMEGVKGKWQKFLCWLGFHDYVKKYGSVTNVVYFVINNVRIELGCHSTCKHCGYLDMRWKINESIACH